ncbi:MAG: zf-TFIIB domain-containing protein [Chloroflexota bacterium]|nr:zf-TFIIB domain-containing protein [Chloroflexota bacterium]
MKCPACGKETIVVEHEDIELDYCVNCSGVWFDAGELELLLETMEVDGARLSVEGILTSPEAPSKEKKRRCPICGRRMKKATLGRDPAVVIDACPREHGLWFDSGELGQLVAQLPDRLDSQGRVITFLGEVFKAGPGG